MNSLPNFLMKRASLTPDRTAIEMGEVKVSFSQLHQNAMKLAEKLSDLGVLKNDVVSIFMGNSIHLVELIFALKHIGAITVLHNLKLKPQELSFQVEDAGSKFLFADEDNKPELNDRISALKIVIFAEMVQLKGKSITIIEDFDLNSVDTIMYTSGTTGFPKGVKQTYGNHFWSATGSALNLGLHEDDCWLLAVPIFHVSGLSILMRSVVYGMKVVIHERFDADKVHMDIMEKGVTVVSVVSAMLNALLEKLGDKQYPASFRCMLAGGGPVPRPMLEECQKKAIPVYQTFGMTETCSQIVTLSPDFAFSKIGSVGKPLFPCQLKIMDNETEMPACQTGEIVVKGPNVTPGYFNREEATLAAVKDGWFYTGDLGYVDEEGFLFVMDRRSDLIISGGENVYPAEIEAVIAGHPLVKEAGVAGVKDDRWGQVPVAFIVPVAGANIVEADILSFVTERLANFKIPKQIVIVDCLPRNASSKLVRRELVKLIPGWEQKDER